MLPKGSKLVSSCPLPKNLNIEINIQKYTFILRGVAHEGKNQD
jgi:hypothetical protein